MKGKAAIDVVCNPLGKSGGALIQQFMILSFGSLANSTPYLGGILLIIVLAWFGAARSLDSQFSPLAKEELHREKESSSVKKTEEVEAATPLLASEQKTEDNGSAAANGAALKVDAPAEDPSGTSAPQA